MAHQYADIRNRFGVIREDRIVGSPKGARMTFTAELEDDPAPPIAGAITYCVANNGSGKREVRALFPTGAPVVIATEP